MPDQAEFLDVLAQNTIAVMTVQPDKKGEWWDAVQQLGAQARQAGDEETVALLEAVGGLLMGDKPEMLKPKLEGAYAACWERILKELREPIQGEKPFIDETGQIVLKYLNAKNEDELKSIIRQHFNVLFTDEALQVVDQILEKYAGDLEVALHLEARKAFLQRYREVVFKAAFAEMQRKSANPRGGIEIPPGFEEDINEIVAMRERARRDPRLLVEKIELLKEILARLPEGKFTSFRASMFGEIGTAYANLPMGERGGNLEKAIACYEEALKVYTPESDPIRYAGTQNNLGEAYRNLQTGDRGKNLEKAIECYGEALKVFTPEAGPLDYAMTQNNLGAAYTYLPMGDRGENLEKAIACYREALKVYTPESAPLEYAATQNNLGVAYRDLPTGDWGENLETAIACYREALKVYTPAGAPMEYAGTQNNLGLAYADLPMGDRGKNLEKAIAYYREALKVYTPAGAPMEYAGTQNNLGIAYSDLLMGDRGKNLEKAIACYREALKVYAPESASFDYAMTQNNMGNAYRDLPMGNRGKNLEKAIACYREALKVYTPDTAPMEYAMAQNNLGNAYADLPTGDRGKNLEKAIACYEKALKVYTPESAPMGYTTAQNNLGTAYADLPTGDRGENLKKAIACYEEALRFHTLKDTPYACRRTARNLGGAYGENGRWTEAAEAFKDALKTDQLIYEAALSQSSKEGEMSKVGNLYAEAGYALAKAGEERGVVEALERGRARQMREELEGKRRDLEQLEEMGHGDLLEEYWEASQRLRELVEGTRPGEVQMANEPGEVKETTYEERENAHWKLREAIKAIQQVKGFETFMRSLAVEDIQKVAGSLPLVYLAASRFGGVELVVTEERVKAIWLEGLTEEALQEKVVGAGEKLGGYLGAYAAWREDQNNSVLLEAWGKVLEGTTGWLWGACMERVTGELRGLGMRQAVLIPTGWLGLLPLHAAWHVENGERKYIDDLILTYTPSAHALQLAISEGERKAERLLGLQAPGGSLQYAGEEIEKASEHFHPENYYVLYGLGATPKRALEMLPEYDVLHFSTHGLAGFTKPLESGLQMGNGQLLTLGQILKKDLPRARLALLSACETGIPGTKNLDESVSFPAGFMQAGVPGVVGTLWCVEERSTMLVVSQFYELWREKGLSPGEALHQACIWLRDEYKEVDYSHPHYWAAFTYHGV